MVRIWGAKTVKLNCSCTISIEAFEGKRNCACGKVEYWKDGLDLVIQTGKIRDYLCGAHGIPDLYNKNS